MSNEMIQWLKEYLKNTSEAEKKKDWDVVESMNLTGPTAVEYVTFLQSSPCLIPSGNWQTKVEINIPEKYNPDYNVGVCFFSTIAL